MHDEHKKSTLNNILIEWLSYWTSAIHFPSRLCSFGSRVCWTLSQLSLDGRQGALWTGCQPIAGHTGTNNYHLPLGGFEAYVYIQSGPNYFYTWPNYFKGRIKPSCAGRTFDTPAPNDDTIIDILVNQFDNYFVFKKLMNYCTSRVDWAILIGLASLKAEWRLADEDWLTVASGLASETRDVVAGRVLYVSATLA